MLVAPRYCNRCHGSSSFKSPIQMQVAKKFCAAPGSVQFHFAATRSTIAELPADVFSFLDRQARAQERDRIHSPLIARRGFCLRYSGAAVVQHRLQLVRRITTSAGRCNAKGRANVIRSDHGSLRQSARGWYGRSSQREASGPGSHRRDFEMRIEAASQRDDKVTVVPRVMVCQGDHVLRGFDENACAQVPARAGPA
jgi:hypothetical protein